DPGLAFAVIAVAPRLEDERQPDLQHRRGYVPEARDPPPRRDPRAAAFDELLLRRTVLRDGQRSRSWLELVAEHRERFHGQVLEFVGGDVDRGAEPFQCGG